MRAALLPALVAAAAACAAGATAAEDPEFRMVRSHRTSWAEAAPSSPSSSPSVALTVDFASPPLRTDYLGLSAVHHGFTYMPEETYRGMNDTYRAINTARLKAARVHTVRSWFAPEWFLPGGWGTPPDFSSPRFEAWVAWIEDMQSANVSVVWNAFWWFTQNTCSPGPPSNCTPTNASVAVYTSLISQTVTELLVRRGLTNCRTLLLWTEPLSYTAGIVPPGYTQQTFYAAVVRALHDQLVADGVRGLVTLLGPNDGGLSSPAMVQALNYTVGALNDVLDVYSSHDYDLQGYAAWHALFESATNITGPTDKPFWVDEGGAGPEAFRNTSAYGTYLGQWQAGAINAGASTTMVWLWQDQYYPYPLQNETNGDSFDNGLHRWGLGFWLPASEDVRPAYFAWTIMSRFLRAPEGSTGGATTLVVRGQEPGTLVASALTGGASSRSDYLAVLLVNESPNATVSASVDMGGFPGWSTGTTLLSRYLYDPANVPSGADLIGPSGTASGPGPLTDSLPPGGVVVWASRWETTE